MPRGQPIILPPVSAGIRQDQVPPLLDPTATLWRSQNVIPRFGEIRLRPGVTKAAAGGGPGGRIAGGMFYKTVAGGTVHVVVTTSKWWQQSAAGWTDISGGGTIANDPNHSTRFLVFPSGGVNFLLSVNNVDQPRRFDHTAAASAIIGAAPDTARDLTSAGNYVLMANVVESGTRSPSRVRASALNDPLTWPAGNVWNLNGEDDIVAIRRLGRTAFIVHKAQSQWIGAAIAGTLPFTIELLEERPGPVSPAAVVSFGGAQYYLASDYRIYRATGVGVEAVSDPIDRIFVEDATFGLLGSLKQRAFGFYRKIDRTIWFVYPALGQTDPKHAVSYDVRTGAMHTHVLPFTVTAGWPGDDLPSVTWADLASLTWANIAATYPTWASMVGTQQPIDFLGSVAGVAYKFLHDIDDDGTAISASWEYPLAAWAGVDKMQRIDAIESSFEQITGGDAVTVQVGTSDADAETAYALAYTSLGTHDTTLTTRQLKTVTDLTTRLASIKYSVTTSKKMRFRGALLWEWAEGMP